MGRRLFFLSFSLFVLLLSVEVLSETPKWRPLRTDAATSGDPSRSAPEAVASKFSLTSLDVDEDEDEGQLAGAYLKLPLSFEANRGQTDADVSFLSRGGGYALYLTRGGEAILCLLKPGPPAGSAQPPRGYGTANFITTLLRMKLLGANPSPTVHGLSELPGKSDYFLGNDPAKWRVNVPRFARVEYSEVYPGVKIGRAHV